MEWNREFRNRPMHIITSYIIAMTSQITVIGWIIQ